MNEVIDFRKLGRGLAHKEGVSPMLYGPAVPDTGAAKVAAEAEREMGVPAAAAVLPEFDTLLKEHKARKTLEGSTALQGFLRDSINASLARDDLESLNALEKTGNAVRRGAINISAGTLTWLASRNIDAAQFVGKSRAEIEAAILPPEYRKSLEATGQYRLVAQHLQAVNEIEAAIQDRTAEDFAGSASRQLTRAGELREKQAGLEGFQSAARIREALDPIRDMEGSGAQLMAALDLFAQNPSETMVFLGETLAESSVPLVAGAAATLVTRNPNLGIGALAAGSFTAEASGKLDEFLTEQGADLKTPEGIQIALSNPALMREAQEKGFAKGIVVAALDALSGGVAGQTLASSPMGDALLQSFVQASLGAAGEAGGELAAGDTPNVVDALLEGLVELAGTPIEVVGVAGRSFGKTAESAIKSGNTAETLAAIDKSVTSASISEAAPDRFSQFLDSTGLSEAMLYVPAEALQTFYQPKDVDLVEFLELDPETFENAIASGGDVAIPASAYAAKISGTDDAAFWHENATLDADEMSVSEAQRFNDEVQEILRDAREQVERDAAATYAATASDIQVRDAVFSQLRQAGRSPDVAEREASVWQAFFRTMAARYGDDALGLARQFGVRFEGPSGPERRTRDSLDLALNTIRSKGVPKQEKPPSLVDFVSSRGGIRGFDGIADAPDLVAADETADLLGGQDDLSIEATAQSALEAGFFPDMQDLLKQATDASLQKGSLEETFLNALRAEVSEGTPAPHVDMAEIDNRLAELAAEIERLGLSIEQSNDEIVAALNAERSEDETLFQVAAPVESDAFVDWAGDGYTMLEPDEVNDFDFRGQGPFVIRAFHGTTHEFEVFNASVKGTKEGQFGAVNYFSTNESDATGNYAGEGPDLTGRIENVAERIVDDIQDVIDDEGVDVARDRWSISDSEFSEDTMEVARNIARRDLSGGQNRTLEVFIRTEKPFVVGGGSSPFIEFQDFSALEEDAIERVAGNEGVTAEEVKSNREEYEDQIDEARWDIESETPSALFEAIDRVAARTGFDAQALYGDVAEFDMEGGRHDALEEMLRSSETLMYAEDPENGDLVGYHVLGEIIEELGFDSIILQNAGDRFENMNIDAGTAHIQVFDSRNMNIKSVENRGTFDPEDPRILYQPAYHGSPHIFDKFSTDYMGTGEGAQAFGSVTFPADGVDAGETIIRLFEGADLSTVLHESGHFFLEAFKTLAEREDAPQGMRDDLEAINRFLGHSEGSYGVEAQEKWARGFEAYALEGKAPSLELADAFARFRAWLVRIYRDLRNLNVKLTDEIREVMDRMLATEEEIAAAREDVGMKPLFEDASAPGMSDAEFGVYARIARRSAEQAEQTLLEKTMAKVRREREKWFKTERKSVRAEVAESTNRKPEYRLVEALANGRWFDGDDTIEVEDMRLDRQALVDRFGDGVIAELSRSRLGGKRAIYGGSTSPDEAAEFFGFESADKMIGVLQNTIKRNDFVEQETDRIMSERYGDPLTDGSIEEEALAAVHSDQQAKTVAAEARQLAKMSGKDTRNITARVFRQRARMMLGRMQVRQISSARFLQTERKAARDAQRAFSKVVGSRDAAEHLTAAQRFKEQQLLNQYLYMEARDFEKYVSSGRERMRRFGKKSVREKLDGGYIEQIDAILEDYDFRVVSQRQLDRRESLKDFTQRMVEAGREHELAIDDRLLDDANKKHYSRLTVEELQGLFDTIDNLDHLGRTKQKLKDAQAERELSAVSDEIGENIRENISGSPPGRGSETPGEKRSKTLRDMLNWTLTADTLLREIDGFEDQGAAYRHMKKPIDEAMARLVVRRQQMADDFDQLYGRYSLAERRDMTVKRQIEGAGISLSKWDVLAVALNTGNEDNYQRLVSQSALTEGQVSSALDTLDRRDWEFVQSMWDYINSFWPEIEAKEKRQTGVAPKKVAAKPMVPAYSFVRGGYYPIRYDNRLSGTAMDHDTKDLAESLMGGRFGKAQTKNGHTKARADSVKRAVSLDISVAHQHVQQVIYDLELAEPLANSWKILQRLKSEFIAKGRVSDFESLTLWLQDTASGEQIAARGWEKFLRHVRSGFTISRLAINISTALIQPTGVLQSAVQIGKADMARGFMSFMSKPNTWKSEVVSISPFMAERAQTFERDIFNVVGDMQGAPTAGAWQKFQRDWVLPASFWLMQKTQFWAVDLPTWVAAYEQEIRRSGDEARARSHADQMVRRAQGSGLMSDRGMLERGTTALDSRQRELPRLLTALGSYMFAKFNVAYERTQSTNYRDPLSVMSLAVDVALLFTMEAFFYQLVKGGLPDDEDDEGWPEWVVKETALSAMATVPISREISGALQGFGGGGIFGSMTETLARPIIQASQGEADKAAVKSFINLAGVALHLPATQVNAAIDAMFGEDMNVRSDPSLGEFLIKRHD